MSDSNLFLASKEIDLDQIDFGRSVLPPKSIFSKKIQFIFEEETVEDEIEILSLKRSRNKLNMKIKSNLGSIYNILNKECSRVVFLEKKYNVKSFKIMFDICELKLGY